MMLRGVLLSLATVLIVVVEGQRAYDCRRTGTLCEGTCLTTGNNAGTCQCGTGRIGYDCSIQGTLRTAALCNNPNCGSTNQICYNNGGTSDLCACTAGFTGPDCSTPRVSTTCELTTMSVTINPVPGASFSGKIFVKGQGTTTQCQFTRPASGTIFTQTFNLNSCGITSSIQQNSGNTIYTVTVVVQYSTLYETIYDEEHVANCIHTSDGQVQGVIGVQPAASRPGQIVTGTTSVTHMEIWRVNPEVQMASGDTATVGEDLELRLFLDSTQYQFHFADSCIAYSSTDTANSASKVLVTGGCIAGQDALNVVRPPMTRNGNRITIPIDAFKFDGSLNLVFQCDMFVCRTGDNRCNPVQTCGSVGTGFGRKKRQAGNKTEVESVQLGVRVVSLTDIQSNSCPATTFESCVQSVPFLAITIIFSVLLLVALVASAFLCFRFTRSQARPEGKSEHAYYNKGMSTA